jgi:hypothetical protein
VFFILAGIALALFAIPRRFRKIAFALTGIVAVLFLLIVIFDRQPSVDPTTAAAPKTPPADPAASRRFDFDAYERNKKDQADPDAKTRISPAQVRFDQIASNDSVNLGTIQSVRARLYNDALDATLTDTAYYLRIQDCLPADQHHPVAECTTVYDQRGWLSSVVPSAQARDIAITVPRNSNGSAPPYKLLGKARIELTVEATRAYLSGALTP